MPTFSYDDLQTGGDTYYDDLDTISADVATVLTGLAIASQQGTLTIATAQELGGLEIEAFQGFLSAVGSDGAEAVLTGQQFAVFQGDLSSVYPQILLEGQSASFEQGDFDTTTTAGLVGQEVAAGQGIVIATAGGAAVFSLPGLAAAVQQGTVTVVGGSDIEAALSGQAINVNQGVIVANAGGRVVALTGQEFAASIGALVTLGSRPGEKGLTGQAMTAFAGVVGAATDRRPAARFQVQLEQRRIVARFTQRN